MSQTTINQAANDVDLQKRVQSAVYAEAFNNPNLADNTFADQVRRGFSNLTSMYFAVAVSTELQYESGILTGRGSPGHDRDVITDLDILAAVQANWPANPAGPTPT